MRVYYALKQLVLYQAMYVSTYCSERFVEIWEVRFTLRCQVLEQKDWKLSLEIVVSYQNICIFIKWKHVKYHAERSKYQFHPGVKIFSFQPELKGTCISKRIHPGLKFHPGVNFTSPTCNMPLRFGLEKCLDYLTEVRLILRYIGLRLT